VGAASNGETGLNFTHAPFVFFRVMSRAFVKEDEREEQSLAPGRASLPDGAVNYVTPRGMKLLLAEKQELEDALASEDGAARQGLLRQRLGELAFRIAGARVIDLSGSPPREVRFGATVRLRSEEGDRDGDPWECKLVGVDEADAAENRVGFYSPVAQAIVGRRAGDRVCVETDEGEKFFEIVSVKYTKDETVA
jgi:transcription elongation factor GreB